MVYLIPVLGVTFICPSFLRGRGLSCVQEGIYHVLPNDVTHNVFVLSVYEPQKDLHLSGHQNVYKTHNTKLQRTAV